MCQIWEKCGEIAKGNFSKIAETAHQASSTEAAYSEHWIAIHSISMASYVKQMTSCNFTAFSPFWPKQTLLSLDVLKDNHSSSVSLYDSSWCFGV